MLINYMLIGSQRKRSGEDGRNGRGTRGGGERDIGRRSANTSTKQDGFVTNGRCTEERRRSNRSISNDREARKIKDGKLGISSNGACKKHENGKLKEPRRRASKNAGIVVSNLKFTMVYMMALPNTESYA